MTTEEIKTLQAMLSLCKKADSETAATTLLILERLLEHLLYRPKLPEE